MNLYPYQSNAIVAIKKNGNRQYLEMPTGSGKTITFLSYARESHKKVLIVVPSRQLLNQISECSLLFYEPWEISRKGNGFDEDFYKISSWEFEKYKTKEDVPRIHICIINSLTKAYVQEIGKEYFDLVIIDEAHHSQSNSYKRLISNFSENIKIVGFTATPDRTDGLMLKNILGKCSFKLEIINLIKDGYLSDVIGFSVKTNLDIEDVDSHNGDFSINLLYKKLCVVSRNEMIVNIQKNEMSDRKTMIFCINIDHSKEINKMLNKSGVSSAHIDGNMKPDQRESILKSFRDGKVSVLCNCQLLTEGFDEPSVDGIIIARPTRSRALFLQMIGRGLRKFPGKSNCKIIDIVDNHRNLSGFNSLVTDQKLPHISKFKGIREISDHIDNEMIKISEFHIERANLFNNNIFDDLQATKSMIECLNKNNILFYLPLSFEEAGFLIWFDKLNKEYIDGKN